MHGIVNVRKLRNGDLKRKQTMIKILIIEDVMLPGMDGFSIVKKLRGMKVWTPIIMLTARVELQDKLQGFDAGAEDYLTKPFEIEELDAAIDKYKNVDTKTLSELSHDSAWHEAWDKNHNAVMTSLNIAKAGDASNEFLEYLQKQEFIDSILEA